MRAYSFKLITDTFLFSSEKHQHRER